MAGSMTPQQIMALMQASQNQGGQYQGGFQQQQQQQPNNVVSASSLSDQASFLAQFGASPAPGNTNFSPNNNPLRPPSGQSGRRSSAGYNQQQHQGAVVDPSAFNSNFGSGFPQQPQQQMQMPQGQQQQGQGGIYQGFQSDIMKQMAALQQTQNSLRGRTPSSQGGAGGYPPNAFLSQQFNNAGSPAAQTGSPSGGGSQQQQQTFNPASLAGVSAGGGAGAFNGANLSGQQFTQQHQAQLLLQQQVAKANAAAAANGGASPATLQSVQRAMLQQQHQGGWPGQPQQEKSGLQQHGSPAASFHAGSPSSQPHVVGGRQASRPPSSLSHHSPAALPSGGSSSSPALTANTAVFAGAPHPSLQQQQQPSASTPNAGGGGGPSTPASSGSSQQQHPAAGGKQPQRRGPDRAQFLQVLFQLAASKGTPFPRSFTHGEGVEGGAAHAASFGIGKGVGPDGITGGGQRIDCPRLWFAVGQFGGLEVATRPENWPRLCQAMNFPAAILEPSPFVTIPSDPDHIKNRPPTSNVRELVVAAYKTLLSGMDEYRRQQMARHQQAQLQTAQTQAGGSAGSTPMASANSGSGNASSSAAVGTPTLSDGVQQQQHRRDSANANAVVTAGQGFPQQHQPSGTQPAVASASTPTPSSNAGSTSTPINTATPPTDVRSSPTPLEQIPPHLLSAMSAEHARAFNSLPRETQLSFLQQVAAKGLAIQGLTPNASGSGAGGVSPTPSSGNFNNGLMGSATSSRPGSSAGAGGMSMQQTSTPSSSSGAMPLPGSSLLPIGEGPSAGGAAKPQEISPVLGAGTLKTEESSANAALRMGMGMGDGMRGIKTGHGAGVGMGMTPPDGLSSESSTKKRRLDDSVAAKMEVSPNPTPPPVPHLPRNKITYVPLQRQAPTAGGFDIGKILRERAQLQQIVRRPRPATELGQVDVERIVLCLRSRVQSEVSYALVALALLSAQPYAPRGSNHANERDGIFPLDKCPDLLEELLDLLVESVWGEDGLPKSPEEPPALGSPTVISAKSPVLVPTLSEEEEHLETTTALKEASSVAARGRPLSHTQLVRFVDEAAHRLALGEEEEDEGVAASSRRGPGGYVPGVSARPAHVALSVINILRNLSSHIENVSALAGSAELLSILAAVCDPALAGLELRDVGAKSLELGFAPLPSSFISFLPPSPPASSPSSSSPQRLPVFSCLDLVNVRKDVLSILANLPGDRYLLDQPSLSPRTVRSLIDLLASFIDDGAAELLVLPAPGIRPTSADRPPYHVELAVEALSHVSVLDRNRAILARDLSAERILSLWDSLIRLLPLTMDEFRLQTATREPYHGLLERTSLCLFNLAFLAPASVKRRLKASAGVGVLLRIFKKLYGFTPDWTHNPWQVVCRRVLETLGVLNEGPDGGEAFLTFGTGAGADELAGSKAEGGLIKAKGPHDGWLAGEDGGELFWGVLSVMRRSEDPVGLQELDSLLHI